MIMFDNVTFNRLTLTIIPIGSNFERFSKTVATSGSKTSKMIKQLSRVALMAVLFAALTAFTVGYQTVKIQTSAVCSMCKDRIEGTLNAIEGVEEARLDLTTKKVKVKFDDSKQSEASLKAIITKIGYAADDLPADEAAFNSLPGCCKSAEACKASRAAGATEAVEGEVKTCASEAKTAEVKASCAKGAAAGKACCASKAKATASVEGAEAPAAKACCSGDKAKSCTKAKAAGTN